MLNSNTSTVCLSFSIIRSNACILFDPSNNNIVVGFLTTIIAEYSYTVYKLCKHICCFDELSG